MTKLNRYSIYFLSFLLSCGNPPQPSKRSMKQETIKKNDNAKPANKAETTNQDRDAQSDEISENIDGSTTQGSSARGYLHANTNRGAWLTYEDGSPHFLCGVGDPEDFLYRGSKSEDGTRNGDQHELIEKLKDTGTNGVYIQLIRSHGGDGDSTHNPFVNNNPSSGLNSAVLTQWDTWFEKLDTANITIHIFLYDDSACIWGCNKSSDSISPNEEVNFIKSIVEKFSKYKNIVWVVAEEYQERFSATRAENIAKLIRQVDIHKHPIALHQLPGLTLDLANSPFIDQFSIQSHASSNQEYHNQMIEAWSKSSGKYNLNLSEPKVGSTGTGEESRRFIWATAMGGAYVMPIDWNIVNTPKARLQECGYMVKFMESTKLLGMSPSDSLAFGETKYVLADKTNNHFILYSPNTNSNLGIKQINKGNYKLKWLDTISGKITESKFSIDTPQDKEFSKPSQFSNELVLYIEKQP